MKPLIKTRSGIEIGKFYSMENRRRVVRESDGTFSSVNHGASDMSRNELELQKALLQKHPRKFEGRQLAYVTIAIAAISIWVILRG